MRSRRTPGAPTSPRIRARLRTGPIPGFAATAHRPNTPTKRTGGGGVTLAHLAALGTLSRIAGEGAPSLLGLVGEGHGRGDHARCSGDRYCIVPAHRSISGARGRVRNP